MCHNAVNADDRNPLPLSSNIIKITHYMLTCIHCTLHTVNLANVDIILAVQTSHVDKNCIHP